MEFQIQEADRGRRGDRGAQPGQVPQGAAAAGGGGGADADRGEPHGEAQARAGRLYDGEWLWRAKGHGMATALWVNWRQQEIQAWKQTRESP